jgi:hypothetical protein
MSQRTFAFAKVFEDGRALSAYVIKCSRCTTETRFVQRGKDRRPPDAAKQYFANRGWFVGARPSSDICPDCLHKRRHLQVVENNDMAVEVPKADEPREMTRMDRRIINDKLDTVYADGSYVAPWSDAKVARDLGVPQQWVAKVRDDFFGPEGSNPEIDRFLEQIEPLMAQAKGYAEQANKQLTATQTLVRSVADLTGRIAELEVTARQLRKETGK